MEKQQIMSSLTKIEDEQQKLKDLFSLLSMNCVIHTSENKTEPLESFSDIEDREAQEREEKREDPNEPELVNALQTWNARGKHPYTLAKEGRQLRLALELWDSAGENPYEVLQEEGLYDFFMSVLNEQKLVLNCPLYRGTVRHSESNVGDKINYVYPKSWTASFEMGSEFIKIGTEGYKGAVILRFTSKNPVKGIPNPYNSNNEDEVVLAPMTLLITRKYKKRGFPVFDVSPI